MATKTKPQIQPLMVPTLSPSARFEILVKSSVGNGAARGHTRGDSANIPSHARGGRADNLFARAEAFNHCKKSLIACLIPAQQGLCSLTIRIGAVMEATPRCIFIALLAVTLASCAWQPAPLDHAHALSEMADKAANDSARCQASGAALGSQAYKRCQALLEDKMSIEDVPPDLRYAPGRN